MSVRRSRGWRPASGPSGTTIAIAKRREEEDGVPSEAGSAEVDPESNAGLALRWRLCHKRGLQRTYRAAAARVEEASRDAAAVGSGPPRLHRK